MLSRLKTIFYLIITKITFIEKIEKTRLKQNSRGKQNKMRPFDSD